MSLKNMSLSELAQILMESTLEKKFPEMPRQKPDIMVDKIPVEQEVRQVVETPVQPMVQAASPAGTSSAGAASSKQCKPVTFELNSSNIIQAVIYSELLTEPVCRRKRRWRNWS